MRDNPWVGVVVALIWTLYILTTIALTIWLNT